MQTWWHISVEQYWFCICLQYYTEGLFFYANIYWIKLLFSSIFHYHVETKLLGIILCFCKIKLLSMTFTAIFRQTVVNIATSMLTWFLKLILLLIFKLSKKSKNYKTIFKKRYLNLEHEQRILQYMLLIQK